MEILNIDELTSATRAIIYNGVRHDMHEPSIQAFIDDLKLAQKVDTEVEKAGSAEAAAKSFDFLQMIELMRDTAIRSFPTLGEAVVKDMPVSKVHAIFRFVREMNEGDTPAAATSETKKKTVAAKK